jgi:predicted alpha-1,2-mannosidase
MFMVSSGSGSSTPSSGGAGSLANFSPVDFVDPFIGSKDCRWDFFTPASTPFGLVKVAPQTSGFGGYAGGGNTTGYDYAHDSIIGFSNLHAHGLGGFLFMPTVGELQTTPGDNSATNGFRSKFRKETEKAKAGYYSVVLDKYNVKAEITATQRVGFHRYTFPETQHAHIIVDVGHLLGEAGLIGEQVKSASISVIDDHSISGSVSTKHPNATGPVTVYMKAEFSKPFSSFGMYRDSVTFDGLTKIQGLGSGFYATFSTQSNEPIEVKVAISFVSTDQADVNMHLEARGKTFDQALSETRSLWNQWLGRIEVLGGDDTSKVKFYTALWHVLLGRGVSEDADGKYLRASGDIGQIPVVNGVLAFHRYNADALWDSFSNLNQLWSLVYPDVMSSYVKFLLSAYEEYGWVPDGFVSNQVAPGMPTNHTTAFMVNAVLSGIQDFDTEEVYVALSKTQNNTNNRPAWVGNEVLVPYLKSGYAGYEYPAYGGTSQTLEYAYQDYCAGQLASKLGKTADAASFNQRSRNYANIFDPETRMFRPRSINGIFLPNFDPLNGYGFAEGNAWQYLWYVPQDIPGLIDHMGKGLFLDRLTETFRIAEHYGFGGYKGNVSGLSLRYNHGNETDLQASWLFNLADRPDLTQYYTTKISEVFYGTTPEHGYGGGQDEDEGMLGSWLVMAGMGLYDVQGGCSIDPQFQVSNPMFDQVVIHLNQKYYSGDRFVIRKSDANVRTIQTIQLNGYTVDRFSISRQSVTRGGQMVLLFR